MVSELNGRIVSKREDKPLPKTGIQELRRIVRVLSVCREEVIARYTLAELVRLQRAAWASEWDIYVDDLSEDQVRAVLELDEVPGFFEGSVDGPLLPLPSGLADNGEVFDFLHPVQRDGDVPAIDELRAKALAEEIERRRASRELRVQLAEASFRGKVM